MTQAEIEETVRCFAARTRRPREAGRDGVDLHAANGYLINAVSEFRDHVADEPLDAGRVGLDHLQPRHPLQASTTSAGR